MSDQPQPQEFYSIAQWGKMAGVGRTNAYYWLRQLKVPLRRVGPYEMIPAEHLRSSLVAYRALRAQRQDSRGRRRQPPEMR